MPRMEELREQWLNAPTTEEQRRIVREMQMEFWQQAPYAPLGQFFKVAAWNKSLADVQVGWPVFHGVRRV